MRISRYVFPLEVEKGWWGLYTPIKHGVCFIPETVWQDARTGEFAAIPEPIVRELLARRILVSDDHDATCLDYYRQRAMTTINSMFLVVIQRCNLACRYCVVENNVTDAERMKDRMTPATADAALRFFVRLLRGCQPREARVTYYGGEPLLNPDVIKHTLPQIRTIEAPGLQRPVEAVMITNGMIYNPEIAALFKHYGSAICISIDGTAAEHDSARVSHKGEGTHARVVETIRRYQDLGIRIGLSCTIGRHNVQSLADVARFFVREIGVSEIEFQMPYQVPADGNPLFVTMSEAADHMLSAAEVMMDELGVYEFTTLRRLESFVSGGWRHRDCGAAGGQIVISPKGKLGPCHSLVGSGRFFDGDVNDPTYDLFEDKVIDEWSSRIPVNMPQCTECLFISLCGGGCPYNALTAHGTIWERDPQVCPYMEKLVPWILRRLWNGRALIGNDRPAALPAVIMAEGAAH